VWAQIELLCEKDGWVDRNGVKLRPETVDLYAVVKYIIKPATKINRKSFVETVATGPQPPKWFISHWWGEPVSSFIACVEQHLNDHGLTEDTPYWVCAYANRQYCLEEDVTSDPNLSSFKRAIDSSYGKVLSIVDKNGETFKRAWCCLEIYLALHGRYEMYTKPEKIVHASSAKILQERMNNGDNFDKIFEGLPPVPCRAVGITHGASEGADHGWNSLKATREQSFPFELGLKALEFSIQDCKATKESDKTHIIKYIQDNGGLECMNDMLRGRFAFTFWRLMLEGKSDLKKYAHLPKHSRLMHVQMSFRNCKEMDDEAFQLILDNLPKTLLDLRLDLKDSEITEAAGEEMYNRIFHFKLQTLYIDGFCYPNGLTQVFSSASNWHQTLEYLSSEHGSLARSIPTNIGNFQCLRLVYLSNNKLTGNIPKEMGDCRALEWLYLQNNQLVGEIPKELGNCTELKVLRLGDNNLQGRIPESLGYLCKMFTLDIRKNFHLTGQVPSTMESCLSLELIRIAGTSIDITNLSPQLASKWQINSEDKNLRASEALRTAKYERNSWQAKPCPK